MIVDVEIRKNFVLLEERLVGSEQSSEEISINTLFWSPKLLHVYQIIK